MHVTKSDTLVFDQIDQIFKKSDVFYFIKLI